MKSSKLFLGAVVGLAAGAVLGILFAPQKGSKTRKKIAEKGNDYVEELSEKFNDMVSTLTQKMNTLQEEAAALVEKGKSAVTSKMSDVN